MLTGLESTFLALIALCGPNTAYLKLQMFLRKLDEEMAGLLSWRTRVGGAEATQSIMVQHAIATA